MSFRKIELSVRGKQVLLSVSVAVVVTTLSCCAVWGVTHGHLRNRVLTTLDLILADLRTEYVEYGGLSAKFRECVDEDVEEQGATVTHVAVFSPDGKRLYATPALRHRHHLRMVRASALHDGNVVRVECDIEDIWNFELFLGMLLVGIGLVSIVSVGLFSFVLGGRILKLNLLVETKNRAIEELRTLTDDIAHDLRTPLTRLNMAAEASLTGEATSGLAESVARDTGAMVEMINTMLEISQTGFRIDRTPREQLALTDIVRQSCELYAAITEDQGVDLVVNLPPGEVRYSAHKAKIQQVVGNLLENALKFTPRGGKVTLSAEEAPGGVRLVVEDTGCGIAEKDIPHVFQRFYRADSSRNLPGNGLGLALVHAIVTSYGGQVSCSSELGKGARFVVELPV